MTDAKGLSEVQRYSLGYSDLSHDHEGRWVLYSDYTALAERLKACEGEIRHIDDALARRPALADKPDRLHKILYTIGEAKRCDQLTADLEESKLRLKMEAECHEQTVADLERARAEVEECAMAMRAMQNVNNNKTDTIERLKVLLEYAEDALRRCGEAGTDTRAYVLIQAAIKEEKP